MLTARPYAAPTFGRRTDRAPARARSWKIAGGAALLCSTMAWASFPMIDEAPADALPQWQAVGAQASSESPADDVAVQELTLGADDSMRALLMRAGAALDDATAAAEMIPPVGAGTQVKVTLGRSRLIQRVDLTGALGEAIVLTRAEGGFALKRSQTAIDNSPLRIRGRVDGGLYWTLRAAGASPQATQQYLSALSAEIDVGGDIMPGDQFDLILASRTIDHGEQDSAALLYAGLDRESAPDLQLVRWTEGGKTRWVNAATVDQPVTQSTGFGWPTAGRITSSFGYRVHPIFRFRRFHSGVDFGASWGSPIVAAADGMVVGAGWAGGYGRQVRLAHGDGVQTSYSHMSQMVATPGSFVRQGQVIGYVGSSGFSTGPHLHYEVIRGGVKVNPLAVRFTSAPVVDKRLANAVKARLKTLMQVGSKPS